MPIGETILFASLYKEPELAVIVKKDGFIMIVNIETNEIVDEKNFNIRKIIGAELNKHNLTVINGKGQILVIDIPSLILFKADNLISFDAKQVVLIDMKVIDDKTVVLLSKESVFICDIKNNRVKIVDDMDSVGKSKESLGDFLYFLENKIQKQIFIITTLGNVITIDVGKIFTKKVLNIENKISFNVPDSFNEYKKIFSGSVECLKDSNTISIVLSVFVNENGSLLYIIDNSELLLLALRYKALTIAFNDNCKVVIGLSNGGVFYFNLNDIRDIEKYKYFNIIENVIDSALPINNDFLLSDRNGGLYRTRGFSSDYIVVYESREYKRLKVETDSDNNSVIAISDKDGLANIVNNSSLDEFAKMRNKKISYFTSELSLEFIDRRIILFSGDASTNIIYFNNKIVEKHHSWLGLNLTEVIKFENYYYLITKEGDLLKLSDEFKVIENNKLTDGTVIQYELYRVQDDLLLVYSTNRGLTGVFSLKDMASLIKEISIDSVNIINAILINYNGLSLVTASKNGINISDLKTGRIIKKINFNSGKYPLKIFNNPDSQKIIEVLANDNIIYTVDIEKTVNGNTINLSEGIIVHKLLFGSETALIKTSKNRKKIIIPNPYGIIEVLEYRGIKPVVYSNDSIILSGFEYSDDNIVLSTGYGELIFIDTYENSILKKDDIYDWLLEFIRYSDTNIAGFSYNGYFYNFILENKEISYVKSEIKAGKIYSADYSFENEGFYLLSEKGLLYYNHFSNTYSVIRRNVKGEKIFTDNKSLIIFNGNNIRLYDFEGVKKFDDKITDDEEKQTIRVERYKNLYGIIFADSTNLHYNTIMILRINSNNNEVEKIVEFYEKDIKNIWFDDGYFYLFTGNGTVIKYDLFGNINEKINTGIDKSDNSVFTGNNIIHSNNKNFIVYKNKTFLKKKIYRESDLIAFTDKELKDKSEKVIRKFI